MKLNPSVPPLVAWGAHLELQINRCRRRDLKSERILQHEKTFSSFAPRTEWINKGKAGVPVELG